ncbi:hypothetical protein FB451DRAFT_1398217 [Mycena latifolia]|nr:hypothetical protein FB451DRAFT_1398217 [Mycena latifolia]
MLEKNRYKDPLDAYTDLSLVFLNALFYNEPDSQIALDAQTLKDLLESEWKSKALPTPRDSPPPSSAQKYTNPLQLSPHRPPRLRLTSTFVYSKPTPILPTEASPIEPPPAQEYLESDSESEVEDLTDGAYEPPPGAPTDAQIARQLERSLPRHAPLLGEDGGWMADVKHERHLEIVQALKAYRDAAGVKLSQALDGVPEDKTPITFKLLESRSRSKTFYTSSRPFDSDVAKMFEHGRRYYLERGGGVAGVGGEKWRRVVALQRVAHALTSAQSPPLPLPQPLVIAPPLQAPGAQTLESPGDRKRYNAGRAGRPIIGRIVGCWRDDANEGGVSVQWYLRADEIRHLMPTKRSMGAIEGEVVQTDKTTHHVLADVLERVACQHISSAPRGRPRAPAWYPGWPLYVCGYRYDTERGVVRRIHRTDWFSGKDGDAAGAEIPEALDLFERRLHLGEQQKKQGTVVDRSVVSAAGMAVTTVEKLAPETKRHFERDPTTGEVLWFPGPPMHDDPMGEDDSAVELKDVDVEMRGPEPSAKRQKIAPQEERYITPPPSGAVHKRSALRSVTIVILCTAAMIVNNSNNTSVSISLPTIGKELHAEEVALQWLVSAYPLSSGPLLNYNYLNYPE